MNIAYIVEMYKDNPHGGIATWTKRLMDYYTALGIQVQVYAYGAGIETRIPNFIKLVPNVREFLVYPYLGKKNIPVIQEKHDLIHFASPLTAAWQKSKIPGVMSTHYLFSRQADQLSRYLPVQYKLFFNSISYNAFKWFEQKGFQNADMITVCRQAFKDYLKDAMKIPEEKIEVIQYGVDNVKFKPASVASSKEPVALYVGRGSLPKGFDTLVEAAKNIKGRVVAVASRIPKNLAQQAAALQNFEIKTGLSEAELAAEYQKATVFVMPSLSEGAPLTTLEAMASGLPVVCTPEGSGEYIQHEQNGLIFDFKNADLLAEQVNYLFENSSLAEKFGKRNRVKVDSELTLPIIADKIMKIYQRLL